MIFFVIFSNVVILLLPGGQIKHNIFKILIKINKLSKCHILKQLIFASVLKDTVLIILDKNQIQQKLCFTANNWIIDKIKDNHKPLFDRILLLFGRNIALTTLVVSKNNKAKEVNLSNREWVQNKFGFLYLT